MCHHLLNSTLCFEIDKGIPGPTINSYRLASLSSLTLYETDASYTQLLGKDMSTCHVYLYLLHTLLLVKMHNSTTTCSCCSSCYYMLSTYMQRTAKLLLLKALLFSNIIAHMYIAVHVYRYNRHEQLCIYTCHACIGIDMSSCKY